MNDGLERIRQGLTTLKPSERKVAQYILKDPDKILAMPIAQLARGCEASEATIIRMCRSLQFNGFRELKLSISASVNKGEVHPERYQDISSSASIKEIIEVVSSNNLRSIEDTLSVLNESSMEAAVTMLENARKILVVGVGASAIVAQDFEQKCKRINKWCEALTDSHAQLTSAVHLTKEDVVLAVSYSGETKEIIDTIKIARENKAAVISITSYGNNEVQGLSNVNLFASNLEQSIRSGATASRIAQLNIVDILFTGLASKNYQESIGFLDKTRNVIQNRF
ncbi:MurR/RpiR family transcriptional regulator [Sediminibacillus halophilus]|uniref:DNA-binding transcriptional regulator, MurR/RpiR family, contains HTH and SIS domains n=1 Tax=Sediminibacillus halophilus TaxID=482461 RepID=A0A1G9RFH0_9BACI|nr:MurR/RpiR family transcriptional regulator [Sediminibacillus halophilus]SDM21998.1 DNA-binding transcriptional regulator, MurR/RpiR family, contains HTH and SIS domains [Sediminibacillus halophilus]